MVSVCLPSDALLEHLPSYLGFSYLGHGVSLHGCSSKAQPAAPYLGRRVSSMEYYLAIKKNTFESVLMSWMKLEPITQSEVSQKEKHQYRILKDIHGI